MQHPAPLVKDRLHSDMEALTPSERRVASALLTDYPVAGLQSITKLAVQAEVSTPTVIRMARKLGFDGFPDLQNALRGEVADQIKKPMSKHARTQGHRPEGHTIAKFSEAVFANLGHTLDRLDTATFDAVAALLAEPAHSLYLAGGRITRSNADYLFNHLQIIRPSVTLLGQSANVWPQYLLDMDAQSVLIVFDIRRYEKDLQKLAALAKSRGATLVLFTDQWSSPIAAEADYCFNAMVEAPSSWDSTIAIMLIIEALIAEVQSKGWAQSAERIEELESMFNATRLFRNF
ncbi:RpiR family transcriptional regulator [Litorivita pollutaquae]|uniref:RpiR family transcriptional regulator n=1 Tax=Litorivita pollutaquae TaxID=2200892 RepID=A0A2V4MIV7_9RHOB|nr:MurR/RpiR family transcriptional regulator [Litorivita pollutaquae]OUS20285.1 RpiR family transcriptional regulator [Rhodobacterales bacterium 59_46_T64]PYC46515.1 RpiR family transcriptional regulator [Litorivita pollutaquae]